jgi:hypothetical protein
VVRFGGAAVTVLALLLAGCGSLHAVTGATGHSLALASPGGWNTYGPIGTQIVSGKVDSSGRVLTVRVQMATGQYGCERDLTGTVTNFGSTMVDVAITYQSRLWNAPRACPWRDMTVSVRLPAPLGQREVTFNGVFPSFAPHDGVLIRQCAGSGLPDDGCRKPLPLPPASCTSPSYGEAMDATGPPMHSIYGVLGCDSHWLVLNVGWPGGAVGCDGPSCGPDVVTTRWFFRASPHGWLIITRSLTAGCTQVHKVAPQFPGKLCASLPAPG